jgi:hypothetical protein
MRTYAIPHFERSLTLVLIFIFWLTHNPISAQFSPEIISCAPNSGYKGQSLDVFIRGNNTQFDLSPQIELGEGVRIDKITVQSNVLMVLRVTVLGEALDGPRNLKITAGGKTVFLENAFDIFTLGAEVSATMMVYPVSVVYASDLKSNNIKNSPMLFSIQVMNDAVERKLEARLSIKGQRKGLLANATKPLGIVSGQKIISFSNRDLSEISISEAGQQISDYLQETGILPPDLYYYILKVVDLGTGKVVAEAEGVQEIGNQAWEIQLLSPGSPMDQSPEPILVSLPFFQWFSQAESYDFALYEVRENSSSAEDITQSLPVYRQSGIKGSTLWWPNSAEPLVSGKTYAWQIKANLSSTSGPRVLLSPVWWFTVGKTGTGASTIPQDFELFLNPPMATVGTGQPPTQFTLSLLDKNKTLIPVKSGVEWKLIPSIAGRITQDGKFTPGDRPMKCAVVAQYGEKSQFADVDIEWKSSNDFGGGIKYFIRELFGLP